MTNHFVPNILNEVLDCLAEPDFFNVVLTDKDRWEIFQQISNNRKYGIPRNFLEWRDAAYDAMEDMGYELS